MHDMSQAKNNRHGFVRTYVVLRDPRAEHRSQLVSPTRRHLVYYCSLIRFGVWFRDKVLDSPPSPPTLFLVTLVLWRETAAAEKVAAARNSRGLRRLLICPALYGLTICIYITW